MQSFPGKYLKFVIFYLKSINMPRRLLLKLALLWGMSSVCFVRLNCIKWQKIKILDSEQMNYLYKKIIEMIQLIQEKLMFLILLLCGSHVNLMTLIYIY